MKTRTTELRGLTEKFLVLVLLRPNKRLKLKNITPLMMKKRTAKLGLYLITLKNLKILIQDQVLALKMRTITMATRKRHFLTTFKMLRSKALWLAKVVNVL